MNLRYNILMGEFYFHKRNLPHLYNSVGTYFITYRLADSLPLEKLKSIHDDLKSSKEELSIKEKRIFKKYDELLDSGMFGHKYLAIREICQEVKKPIHYEDGKEYELICYCIMPNHVHLVFNLLKENRGISKIMQSIKRISARRCNDILHHKRNFWQVESFDRLVRSENELSKILNYVVMNPVKANLVNNWQKWKHTYVNKNYLWMIACSP